MLVLSHQVKRLIFKSTSNSSLTLIPLFHISTTEARRIMQLSDASMPLNDEELKKQYLKLAKIYHPDAQGSSVSFCSSLLTTIANEYDHL